MLVGFIRRTIQQVRPTETNQDIMEEYYGVQSDSTVTSVSSDSLIALVNINFIHMGLSEYPLNQFKLSNKRIVSTVYHG